MSDPDPRPRFDRPRPAEPDPEPLTLFDPVPDPTADPPVLFPTAAPPVVSTPATGTIEANFAAFHAANPWVYTALVRLARDLKRRGRHHQGIGMLYEVLRWQWSLATADPASDFKLNNNYRSRYARMIMDKESDLDGVFETRILTAP